MESNIEFGEIEEKARMAVEDVENKKSEYLELGGGTYIHKELAPEKSKLPVKSFSEIIAGIPQKVFEKIAEEYYFDGPEEVRKELINKLRNYMATFDSTASIASMVADMSDARTFSFIYSMPIKEYLDKLASMAEDFPLGLTYEAVVYMSVSEETASRAKREAINEMYKKGIITILGSFDDDEKVMQGFTYIFAASVFDKLLPARPIEFVAFYSDDREYMILRPYEGQADVMAAYLKVDGEYKIKFSMAGEKPKKEVIRNLKLSLPNFV